MCVCVCVCACWTNHGKYGGTACRQLDNAVTFDERSRMEEVSGVWYSLQHLFCGITAHVIGHGISTVQCCFHVQATDEVFGVFLVEVKSQLSHICPEPEIPELIFGGAVLSERKSEWGEMGLERWVDVTPKSLHRQAAARGWSASLQC